MKRGILGLEVGTVFGRLDVLHALDALSLSRDSFALWKWRCAYCTAIDLCHLED